jgi:hypothetical protein
VITTSPVRPLALREVAGNLTLTDKSVAAVYVLHTVPWSWRSREQLESTLAAQTVAWSGLADKTIHVRVTQRPYPAAKWAAKHTANTPHPGDPAGFDQMLAHTQAHLRSTTLADVETYVLVPLADRSTMARMEAAARKGRHHSTREGARLSVLRAELDDLMAALGRPATQEEVDWLIHRSVGLGLPEPLDTGTVPGALTTDDIATFYDSVDIDPQPNERVVRMIGHPHRNGTRVERFVTVLSMGRMEGINVPGGHSPWMATAEELPFPVEFSVRANVLTGSDAAHAVQSRIDMIADQDAQTIKYDIDRPPVLDRVRTKARARRDRQQEGTATESVTIQAWVRMAVSGRTYEECTARARAVVKHYKDYNETRIEWPRGQADLIREFVPGEPLATRSHRRVMPVDYWSAGLPHRAASVGDRQGTYLGRTVGTASRGVAWDPHFNMEVREGSGLSALVGAKGDGKSLFLGYLLETQAERGVSCTALDPAGSLGNVRGARVLNLLDAPEGALSPYWVIPDPVRDRFRAAREVLAVDPSGRDALVDHLYERAVAAARSHRKAMAMNVCRELLPPELRGGTGDGGIAARTRGVLRRAIDAVEPTRNTSMGTVLDRVRGDKVDPEHCREIAATLHAMREMPQCALFFGAGYLHAKPDADDTLVVITMPGLVLPKPDSDPNGWSEEERIGGPLLSAAAHYTARRVYDLPMGDRKFLALDEAHRLRYSAIGREFLDDLARNITRKWNTRAILATQRGQDLYELDAEGLLGEMFLGRLPVREVARAALKMAGLPLDVGYEERLGRLGAADEATLARTPYRDFVMVDADGRADTIRVDYKHRPGFLAAMDNSPAAPDLNGSTRKDTTGLLVTSR